LTNSVNTEEKILRSARAVFLERGFAGARMREIAERAQINKGLLHYYFRSKEVLFERVFEEIFFQFIPLLNSIFESPLPLMQKIDRFIHTYLDFISQNPDLPLFIIHELNQNPEIFLDKISKKEALPNPMQLIVQLQTESSMGRIRPVQPIHLIVNIISMCLFPWVGKPVLKAVFQMDDEAFDVFMKGRKEEIFTFVESSLRFIQTDKKS
jgi:TetR/AcrR family transcriptional regulator